MGWGEVASTELPQKAFENFDTREAKKERKPFITAPAHASGDPMLKKRAIILDMGEASREQGFRLNGCR